MAIDLEAIRRKIQQLNGQAKKTSSVQMWKPTARPTEYKIRALPWADALPGEPIKERSFYFLGEQKSFLVPSQFGKPDPIEKLRMSLFASKNADDKALGKTLFPKVYGYLPIIDREDEAAGIQIWKFAKMINTRLLGFFVDEDCGDFLDVLEGRDLKVMVTQAQGKKFLDFTVDYRAKSTPLHIDGKKREEILTAIPNLDDLHPYAFKTTDQIEVIVNAWLNGDSVEQTKNEGTSKGSKADDELESLSKDLNSSAKADKPARTEKPAKTASVAPKKKVEDELDEEAPKTTASDLDDAFKELMEEN
jgi:hypothetical protein